MNGQTAPTYATNYGGVIKGKETAAKAPTVAAQGIFQPVPTKYKSDIGNKDTINAKANKNLVNYRQSFQLGIADILSGNKTVSSKNVGRDQWGRFCTLLYS